MTIMTSDAFDIGRIVRREREARGWSVAALAAEADVSRAMVAKVERGEANPTAAFLGKLSGAFGLPLSEKIAQKSPRARRGRPSIE